MVEGKNLLRLVQDKLAEKEEVIHELQGQLEQLRGRVGNVDTLEQRLRDAEAQLAEKDEVILELMQQVEELTAKVSTIEPAGAASPSVGDDGLTHGEKDEVILEQMNQILDLSEKNEALENQFAVARENLKEFDNLQKQLKQLLGGN